jgi:hypothetical protein
MHYHKYSLTELEDMLPFERDIYVGLLQIYLEKEQQEKANNNG